MASRPSRSPAVSPGLIGSVITPYTGPASSSATSWNVVAPVMSSPCRMACGTGAAPRHAGSSEKCRFTQPCLGISSAVCGISAPYAVTGQQSGAMARSRSRKAGVPGPGGLEHLDAGAGPRTRATGLGDLCRPRPAGASGRVSTATTSCLEPAVHPVRAPPSAGCRRRPRACGRPTAPSRRSACGETLTWHGLTPPLGLADLLDRQLALLRVEPVDEQHAVEMIGLVLDAAGELAGALQRDRLAVHVEAFGDHAVGAAGRDRPGRGRTGSPRRRSRSPPTGPATG